MIKSFFSLILILSSQAFALSGIERLEKKILEKNPEFAGIKAEKEAEESLYQSTYSNFLPTLDAVTGWEQVNVNDLDDNEKGYFGYLDVKYNLFRGFRDQAINEKQDIQVSLKQLEIEQKKRELKKELVSIASEMIYLHKLEDILEEESEITKVQKKMAERKVAAGLTSSVDNLEFEIRESEIEIIRKQIAQLHVEAHEKIVKLTGENVSEAEFNKISFSPIWELTRSPESFSIDKSIAYKRAQLFTELSQQEKTEARSEFLPTVDLTYSVGRFTPLEPGLSNYNESRYGLRVTIPLFSGFGSYYRTKAGSALIAAREKQKSQSTLDIVSAVNIIKKKKHELLGLYDVNEKKMVVAKKYYEMTLSEYKRGIKNSPDLVGATERWFDAQKRKYELLKELEMTEVELQTYL